jgi:hypothetical protein
MSFTDETIEEGGEEEEEDEEREDEQEELRSPPSGEQGGAMGQEVKRVKVPLDGSKGACFCAFVVMLLLSR